MKARVRREAYQMKPAYGAPCNRCGVCCEVSPCHLSVHVFGRETTRCPAFSGDPGEATCGLIATPEKFAPVLVAIHGAAAMGAAAASIIFVGYGCCARVQGEQPSPSVVRRFERLDRDRAEELATANQLWRRT